MWCVVALTATFLLEYAAIELIILMGYLRTVSKSHPAGESSFKHEARSNWQLDAASRDGRDLTSTEFLALQVPPMLCVLFLGLALRSIQFALLHSTICKVGMGVSTAVAVLQAAIAGYTRAQIMLGYAADMAEVGPFFHLSTILRLFLLLCLYTGTSLTIATVFAIDRSQAVPLSTTMRCVMLLSLAYFIVHVAVVGGAACQVLWRWSSSVADCLQNSLAFAPMLCVMMIGVRLRAMQLGVQDPPPWAQVAMWIASVSVVAKVVCSMVTTALEPREADASSSDEDAAAASSWKKRTAAEKLVAIALLATTLLATFLLYIAVSVLIVAVFVMESEAEKIET
jgi:hypothetical protein